MHLLDALIEQLHLLDEIIATKIEQTKSNWARNREKITLMIRADNRVFIESFGEMEFLIKTRANKNILIKSIQRTINTKQYENELFERLDEFECQCAESLSDTRIEKKQFDLHDVLSIKHSSIGRNLNALIALIKKSSVHEALSARFTNIESRAPSPWIPIAPPSPIVMVKKTFERDFERLKGYSTFFSPKGDGFSSSGLTLLSLTHSPDSVVVASHESSVDDHADTDTDPDELPFQMDSLS